MDLKKLSRRHFMACGAAALVSPALSRLVPWSMPSSVPSGLTYDLLMHCVDRYMEQTGYLPTLIMMHHQARREYLRLLGADVRDSTPLAFEGIPILMVNNSLSLISLKPHELIMTGSNHIYRASLQKSRAIRGRMVLGVGEPIHDQTHPH